MWEFKERIIQLLQEASERLRLPCQPTLHAIQTLNILQAALPRLAPTLSRARHLAAALLLLYAKFYDDRPLHMRDLVRAFEPRLREAGMEKKDMEQGAVSGREAGEAIREYGVAVMVQLRWKLAIPLLYDEVIAVARAWDIYAAGLSQFPLKFECINGQEDCHSHNHNFLVHCAHICLFNFIHLIKQTPFESLSPRIRRLALALFLATIKQLLKDQMQNFILSPKQSLDYLLSSFFKKNYGIQVQEVAGEVALVNETLSNYRQSRQKSKQKLTKKTLHKSNKHSEDKENVPYYVNRQNNTIKSKCLRPEKEQQTQKYKSRSRSKADKERSKSKLDKSRSKLEKETCRDKSKLISSKLEIAQLKSKESVVLRPNHKKTSSTKTIHHHKESFQPQTHTQILPQKKVVKFSKSRTSKRQKSQLNSKIIPNSTLEENFTSKSTYWLKANTLGKTDKKSTNSSIRMKIR